MCICPTTEPSRELRSMMRHLLDMLAAPSVSGPGRDSAINLLVKQVPRKSQKNPDNSLTLWVTDQGMGQTSRLWLLPIKKTCCPRAQCGIILPLSGLKNILEVAGTVPEIGNGPPLTDNSHMSASVLLNKLYDDLKSDAERENFSRICEEYVK